MAFMLLLFFKRELAVFVWLNAEPVGIELLKSEGFIEGACFVIALNNLKICIFSTSFHAFLQKSGADLARIAVFSKVLFYMDRIDADVIPVENAKSGCDDLAIFLDGSADGLL